MRREPVRGGGSGDEGGAGLRRRSLGASDGI